MSSSKGLSRAQRLRLIRWSPLVTGLLLAVVWFSIPSGLWTSLITGALSTTNTESVTTRAQRFFENADGRHSEADLRLTSFAAATAESWLDSVPAQQRLFSSANAVAVTPLSIPASSPAFAALDRFERQTEGRVFAWVLQPMLQPPLIVSAVTSDALLFPSANPRKIDLQTPLLWNTWHTPGYREPIDWTAIPGHFVSSTDATRDVDANILNDSGTWWLLYIVRPHDTGSIPADTTFPSELLPIRPQDPSWRATLVTVAQQRGFNVFVYGPLALPAVPLRLPKGATMAQARALGQAIWPNDSHWYLNGGTASISRLSSYEASVAAGSWAAVLVRGIYGQNVSASQPYGQSIMYAAIWKTMPSAAGVNKNTPARQATIIAVAPVLPFALLVAIVLFVASLIASVMSLLFEAGPTSPHSA